MRVHEIDMKGNLWLQKVSSVPAWSSADESRFVYDKTTKTFWFGTDTKWVPFYAFQKIMIPDQSDIDADDPMDTLILSAGDGMALTTVPGSNLVRFDASFSADDKITFNTFFSSGRKLWIFEDVAPTGW